MIPQNDSSRLAVCHHWLEVLAAMEHRLYCRAQTPEGLAALAALTQQFRPSVIISIGALSGLELRIWCEAAPEAAVHTLGFTLARLEATCKYFPFDAARVRCHQENICNLDIKALWNAGDRVFLYVAGSDNGFFDPGIMPHLCQEGLPHLPEGSLVVVNDLWYSANRLKPADAEGFFRNRVLPQSDELQCFSGYWVSYHQGGACMGARETAPLLDFVNARGLDLTFPPNGKQAWFIWPGPQHQKALISHPHGSEHGGVEYNPLHIPAGDPLTAKVLAQVAHLYRLNKIQDVQRVLLNVFKNAPNPAACQALAICQARLGQLDEAHRLAQAALQGGASHESLQRLARDLRARVGRPAVQMTGKAGLTLFAVPKPFRGHDAIIQRNALRSWARLTPRPEIILLGADHGVREMAEEIGARYIPEIAVNEFGTPLVNDIFQTAWCVAANDILAYVNADIILLNDFVVAATKAAAQFPEFLIIGQRWDLPVWEEIDFSAPEWIERIRKDAQENGFLHAETGLDYFIHRRGLWRGLPPFALGRTAWDNWLVKRPLEDGCPIIDGTGYITAVHQDHGYAHCKGGRQGAWKGIEATRNRALAGDIGADCFSTAAGWRYTSEGQIEPKPPVKASRQSADKRQELLKWLQLQVSRMERLKQRDLAVWYRETVAGLQ